MWNKIKTFFSKAKPAVNKLASLYAEHEELISKGVKPAVHQAVKMGYVDKDKEDKLIKQIEKGMKKTAEEISKRETEKGGLI